MPNPDKQHSPEEKVRLYVLRCKALLLLPSYSKDSERCCSAALKLRNDRPDLWVLLSECFTQRGATKEACEALDNALRLDSRNEKALSQYSQVLRIRSADSKLPLQESRKYLSEAVLRAKEAVAVSPASASCWHLYGIALLSEALSNGMNVEGAQRSLKALEQASRIEPRDPDVCYNKGAVEGVLGYFGSASCDLLTALEEDPHRLKGARKQLEDYLSIIRRAISMTESMQRTGKKAFTSLVTKLAKHVDSMTLREALERETSSLCKVSVGVVDVLSETTMEPMVVLSVDRVGEFCLLLFHGIRRGTFKMRDAVVTLTVPKSNPVRVTHEVPAIPFLDTSAYSCSYVQVIVDVDSTIVNGAPISSQMRVPPQVSTRLFI
ncbi:hypothetical protein, conserved [Trypanosoma brucei gambiense DAL972]|nr:hypothetical protein, conserved [Trypanosoma brucei gambiense DAL972]CBH11985.1 hypothetical protein, conserved [Trypanosoma brucei gambiense DAL972]|eukprot:XP_011774270.1 hypothetical protein, conserved [Trypanosoma brucei gambiense DAL972]